MAQVQLKNVRHPHEAMIDLIIANPAVSGGELAKTFKYTESWVSIILNSSAFRERLAERKAEIVDPKLRATVDERVDAVARKALDRLLDRLDNPLIPFRNMELISAAKLGVKEASNPTFQQNNYVVHVPSPVKDSQAWVSQVQGRKPEVIDISQVNSEP